MKKSVIMLSLSLCIFFLWGQNSLSEYSFSYSVSPYLEITDGTLLGSETTDDEYFVNPANPSGGPIPTGPGFPIGFDFQFAGHSFDKVGISANGWISLGDSSTGPNAVNMKSTNPDNHSPLSSVININPDEVLVARIAGFTRNLQAQTGSSIRIKQQGTAPYRELIVQWKNYRRLSGTGDSFNFQICLKEQDMQVLTRYQLMQTSLPCTGQIGLRAAPATTATNFANRTTTAGWASSLAGTAASNYALLTDTNYPEPGATFTWTASPPPNIYIHMQGNDAVISWDPIHVDENGNNFIPEYYDLYYNEYSTASEGFTFLARIPFPGITYTHSGVGSEKSHMMYRVKAVRLSD